MRRILIALAAAAVTTPLAAQSVDSLIAKYLQSTGGSARIAAVTSLRRSGKFTGGGGFEAIVVQENKRPNAVREEFALQGMTGINAYDGTSGWKIQPWSGKKDAEALGEEELHSMLEDADFDGPLVNYKQKGNKVEFVGMDQVEGTDVYKLKITLANGDSHIYYLDTDYCVPIQVDITRVIRGAEVNYTVILGDYKQVNGWYLPFSIETRAQGSPDGGKITFDKIEANVTIDNARFARPVSH
jgi:hypothetical protein